VSFVTTLGTDTNVTSAATWTEVERAISALDGRTETLVILAPASPIGAPEGDHHFAIGGGREGRSIVYTTEDNLSFWNLIERPQQGDERPVLLRIGGQEGEYRSNQPVSRELALRAARSYFEYGHRDPSLEWTAGP
jgi:Immunity protein Imm1